MYIITCMLKWLLFKCTSNILAWVSPSNIYWIWHNLIVPPNVAQFFGLALFSFPRPHIKSPPTLQLSLELPSSPEDGGGTTESDTGLPDASEQHATKKARSKCGRPANPIPRHKRDSHIKAEYKRRDKIQVCWMNQMLIQIFFSISRWLLHVRFTIYFLPVILKCFFMQIFCSFDLKCLFWHLPFLLSK